MGHFIHPFTEGDLVRDTVHNETIVFADRIDGYRAQQIGVKMRLATAEEAAQFQRKYPETPFNPLPHA